jgi:hypothetical protein
MITDETMPKGTTIQWWCTARRPALAMGLAVLGMALAGCSTDMFGSHAPTTTGSTSPWSGVGDFFRGQPEKTAAASDAPSDNNIDCPSVEIRQGASTYALNNEGDQSALTLRMQATFGQSARECHVNAGMLSIKVGIQGRIILGPAGAPGDFTVPLRYRSGGAHCRHPEEAEAEIQGKNVVGWQWATFDALDHVVVRKASHQPRKATIVALRARMSAITAFAPAALSCAGNFEPAWLPPTYPIDVMPAAVAAAIPTAESSTTMQSLGATRILAAAWRKRSGAGLPRATSFAENRFGSKKRSSPVASRLTRMRSRLEDEATHFGPRTQLSA